MNKTTNILIKILLCWLGTFIVTLITTNGKLELGKHILYSFIFGLIVYFLIALKIGSKTQTPISEQQTITNLHKDKILYVYEGEFSKNLVCRVIENRIYLGTKQSFDYEIKDNKICPAFSNKFLFRIEGNLIYKDTNRTTAVYRIEKNKIYEGQFAHKVVYRLSNTPFG